MSDSDRAAPPRANLLSGPASEPLSLAEAKAWLRVETGDEDDLVSALVVSARMTVEATTRRLLVTQAWRLTFDAWGSGPTLDLPLAPFQSVGAVRVRDASGAATLVAPSTYALDPGPEAARLTFSVPPPPPGAASGGVEVDVVVGYGDAAADVPAPLRLAIRALVARWWANRGDEAFDAGARLPSSVAALVEPFRRVRLA